MKKNLDNMGKRSHREPSSREQAFDSSGPDGKVRGTAKRLFEKYMASGRDALSAGDRMTAERFFQHAEHYRRVLWKKESSSSTTMPLQPACSPRAHQQKPDSDPRATGDKEAPPATALKRSTVRKTVRKPKAKAEDVDIDA